MSGPFVYPRPAEDLARRKSREVWAAVFAMVCLGVTCAGIGFIAGIAIERGPHVDVTVTPQQAVAPPRMVEI